MTDEAPARSIRPEEAADRAVTPAPSGQCAAGRLVVVEGIDQSGKQTQIERLAARLSAEGHEVRTFAFPAYETPIGLLIRGYLAGEHELGLEPRQLLFAANRWELKPAIESALAAGVVVLVDRYSGSGLAYGLAQGLDRAWLEALEAGLPIPDLVVLLDLPPAVAFARKRLARDRYEDQIGLLERSRDAYRSLAESRGWLVVDALQPVDLIAEQLHRAVSRLLTGSAHPPGAPAARA